jgi:hypothetical protein
MLSDQLNWLVWRNQDISFHTLQFSVSDMVADFEVLTRVVMNSYTGI